MARTITPARRPTPLRSKRTTSRTKSSTPEKKKVTKGRKPAARKPVKGGRAGTKVMGKNGKAPVREVKSYPSAINHLASLVNYERRPPRRPIRGTLTLDRTRRLLADLGNPQDDFRSVHIAGSKGKGSTAAMLANMLSNNGLKVGVYSSPHIVDIRERITINDQLISKHEFAKLVAKIAEITTKYKNDQPTFFEFLTAAAFQYFSDRKVDVAIIETGLGGRFDATNVIKPEVCALTNISMDHMPQLGNTLGSIAAEKAGILKEDVPAISAPQPDVVKEVLKSAASKVGAKLYFAGDDIRFSYRFESSRETGPQARICITTPTSRFDHLLVPLVGKHQAINCGVALAVLDQLKNRGFDLNDELSINGLSNVRLQGRMEMICDNPRVLADGAHNAASIEALMRAIGQNVAYDSMVVVFGCCADKDVDGMLQLIRLGADKVIFTGIKSPRSADPNDLAAGFAEISGRMAQVAPHLGEAIEIAEKAVTREDLICITGSFYLVSEAKSLFANHPHRAMSMLTQSQ